MNTVLYNSILSKYDQTDIERHLIYSYLTKHKLNYKACDILRIYLDEFIINNELYSSILKLDMSNIKELENYLELLIPPSDRKINGAFFTPNYIVDFIINELKPQLNHRNLDPSCGCGAFLIGLTEYYRKTYSKSIKLTLRENVFGSDILGYNIVRSKLLLSIYALDNNELLEETDFNLYTQDSLKTNWKLKFDNVVGNPPYVKFQDLSDDNRAYLTFNWETTKGGAFNLYFSFFELGYKLLNTNGNLGYITPNNYFTSLAGASLRCFLQQKKAIRKVVDFNHKKVFDAQTYTAITFLHKEDQDFILYDRLDKDITPKEFLDSTSYSTNYYEELNSKKWRLLKDDEHKNIKQIETAGIPIGKLFDICVGIATLKDEVFFVDGLTKNGGYYVKTTANGIFEIEEEVTRPVYKISDFKNQKELELNARRIICPYHINKNGSTPIPEEEFKSKYPKCYQYLLSEKESLLKRDKGKIKYSPFYVWGRTQGLNKLGRKLLNPTFSKTPRFLKAEIEESFFTNGYGLFFREEDNSSIFNESNPIAAIKNINAVQKILNSSIMHYYITKTSVSIEGGYPCYQKNFIEKFSIPFLTEDEIKILNGLTSSAEIDTFLIKKYQINLSLPNLS